MLTKLEKDPELKTKISDVKDMLSNWQFEGNHEKIVERAKKNGPKGSTVCQETESTIYHSMADIGRTQGAF